MRPSGGSITSEVCLPETFLPKSHQKSLYARETSAFVPAPSRRSWFLLSRACFWNCSASSSVNSVLPDTSSGRSSGVSVP